MLGLAKWKKMHIYIQSSNYSPYIRHIKSTYLYVSQWIFIARSWTVMSDVRKPFDYASIISHKNPFFPDLTCIVGIY